MSVWNWATGAWVQLDSRSVGTTAGLVVRPWPVDLARALPVTLWPGEDVKIAITVAEAGTVRVAAEDAKHLPAADVLEVRALGDESQYAVQTINAPQRVASAVNAIWKGRKSTFSAVGRLSPDFLVQDGVVPRSKLGEALARSRQARMSAACSWAAPTRSSSSR